MMVLLLLLSFYINLVLIKVKNKVGTILTIYILTRPPRCSDWRRPGSEEGHLYFCCVPNAGGQRRLWLSVSVP